MSHQEFIQFIEPEAPRSTHELEYGQYVSLPVDSPALETIQGQDGTPEDILARMEMVDPEKGYKEDGAKLLVVRDQQGRITFRAQDTFGYQIGKEPRAKLKPKTKAAHITTDTGAPDLNLLITTDEHKRPILNISPHSYTHDRRRLKITAAEDAETTRSDSYGGQQIEHNRTRRTHRLRRWIAGLALTGAAVHGANTTGGAIDMIMDASTDAGTLVEQTFHADSDKEQRAIDNVARTMQDLDDHNYNAVSARAEAFKQQHAKEFIDESRLEGIQQQVERAQSKEAVLEAAKSFMHFYDKDATLLSHNTVGADAFMRGNIALDTFKQQVLGVMDAYAFLPKKLVTAADFEYVEFAAPPKSSDEETYNGLYISNSKKPSYIRLVTNDYGDDTRQTSAKTTFHENGHALRGVGHGGETGKELETSQKFSFILKNLVDAPDDISEYAAANGTDEKLAEAQAHLLVAGDENKLAHPDDARLFGSEANRQMLEELVAFEKEMPGTSDYVVAHANMSDRGGAWFAFWR